MAALTFTGALLPEFQRDTTVTTTARQIRAPAGSKVTFFSTAAIYVGNAVDDGDALPSGYVSIADPSNGVTFVIGSKARGLDYGTICVFSQSGTITVEIAVETPEGRGVL